MTTIPNIESILLEIRKSLGLKSRYSTDKNTDFRVYRLALQSHRTMMKDELERIFDALEMDVASRPHALQNIMQHVSFQQGLAQHLWTSRASPQQVLWHWCNYVYAPGLGRALAHWNLARNFDPGMPGGEFWFLPIPDPTHTHVTLPVQSVLNWLMDLLGLPMDEVKKDLGGTRAKRADLQDSMERSLYNWKAGKRLDSKSIEKYFPDDATLSFKDVFEVDSTQSSSEQITAALSFVARKGLDAGTLRDQIPMTQPGRIETILSGSAGENEGRLFVELLAVRYAKPSMRLVRQRLRVASMVQDGYFRLVQFLCPGVAPTCADPNMNKVLQPIELIKSVFNLTISAYKQGSNPDEENAWFESRLNPIDAKTVLLSVIPSPFRDACGELGEFLTRRFSELEPDDPLGDLIPLSNEDAPRILRLRLNQLQFDAKIIQHIVKVRDRIRRGSAWRVLQNVDELRVVDHISQDETLPLKARMSATKRFRELAPTPWHTLNAIVVDLGMLLNAERAQRPRDAKQQVETLLNEANSNPARDDYEPIILQFQAKHHLACNEFDTAKALFRRALDASENLQFGSSRGEIARDLLAIEVADNRLIPGNHEKPYRHMLMSGMFEHTPPSLEDTAIHVAEYFWSTLYKPYEGYPVERRLESRHFKQAISDILKLAANADWEGLGVWLKRNAGRLGSTRSKDVRGDSLTLGIYKLQTQLVKLPSMQREADLVRAEIAKVRQVLLLLIQHWPEQISLADFKGQTLLMLAADDADLTLVHHLLKAGAEKDCHDYKGRTALHAAVTGGSRECVSSILSCKPDLKTTFHHEGNTALHSAVKMGNPEIVALLNSETSLAVETNLEGETPAMTLRWILENIHDFRKFMADIHGGRRNLGSEADFIACARILGVV